MAALLLRQGRAGSLKTMLLEGRVFRGLAPTVSLSAESGKSDKGLPPNPKKQSAPKRVVEPKERGKPLTTPAAVASPKHSPAPRAPPSAVLPTGTGAGPSPDDGMQLAEAGVPSFLSGKTSAEFPRDAPSSRKQGSGAEALEQGRRGAGGSSSPSSSSPSSSESESDEEGAGSGVDAQAMHKGKGRVSKPGASHPFEAGAPAISIPAQEKSCSPQPHLDRASAGKPHPARKKAASRKPLSDRKDAGPKPPVPKSPGDTEFVKQNVKESLQERHRSDETGKESQEPLGVPVPPDRSRSGSCARPSGGPVPPWRTEGTTAGQLRAAPPGTRAGPGGHGAAPPGREENPGERVAEGILAAKEEILEERVPVKTLKPVPSHDQDVSREQTAALKPEAKGQVAGDGASRAGEQDAAQEPAPAAAPAEPFDNTTYKNLQHHDYTPYTFLDLNLGLSKFRLPQPSSGRESPRH